MFREVSCIPACDARPAEPIIILPGVDDTAVCDLTMFFDESTIPLWLAQPRPLAKEGGGALPRVELLLRELARARRRAWRRGTA